MASADERIDELYGLPLEEFTKARNELAKALRAEGERELAAKVGKLTKPSRPAWAINRVARERPELAGALTGAAADLAEAQAAAVSGSGREALDDAAGAEREAVEVLVAEVKAELESAGSTSPAMVDRARKTLHAVAGDPELRAELESAQIVADREPVGFGAMAPAPPRTRGKAAAAKTPRKKRDGGASKKEQATRARLAEARRRASHAERRASYGERNVEHAAARVASARERLSAAETELADQEGELERRREELEDAKAVLAELS